jgi:sec-independent protein translocase protein TatA
VKFEDPLTLLLFGVIVLLVLGPKRLPEAGRAIGQSMRQFRQGLAGEEKTELGEDRHAEPQLGADPSDTARRSR